MEVWTLNTRKKKEKKKKLHWPAFELCILQIYFWYLVLHLVWHDAPPPRSYTGPELNAFATVHICSGICRLLALHSNSMATAINSEMQHPLISLTKTIGNWTETQSRPKRRCRNILLNDWNIHWPWSNRRTGRWTDDGALSYDPCGCATNAWWGNFSALELGFGWWWLLFWIYGVLGSGSGLGSGPYGWKKC